MSRRSDKLDTYFSLSVLISSDGLATNAEAARSSLSLSTLIL